MDADGYLAVNFCARYLLQDRSPLIGNGLEKYCEAALRKADLMVEAFDRNVGIDWSIEPA